MTYLAIKSLHVISMVAWMAGLFYLPRLFVYHVTAPVGSPLSETFKVMERKLFRFIIGPASIATWVFGLWLVWLIPEFLSQGWLHAKLLFVVVLTVFHHVLGRWRIAFAEDRNRHPERFYRMMNELPTIVLIVVVFMVILKPF